MKTKLFFIEVIEYLKELTSSSASSNSNIKYLNRIWFSNETATTPDKTVETFQCNFQFCAMQSSCPKGTNSPPSPPLVQCCFGRTAQVCICCVIVNNIAKVEGGNSLLICDDKHCCQGE